MRLVAILAAALAGLRLGAPAMAQAPAPSAAQATATGASPRLDRADVETWFDGVMPYAIGAGDIAGAQVVVVKDGEGVIWDMPIKRTNWEHTSKRPAAGPALFGRSRAAKSLT